MQSRLWSSTLAVFVVGLSASAQITSIPQFTGAASEGFEGPQVIFTPCISSRVFNNQADLCTPGNSGCHTTTSWGYYCTIYPQSGSYLYGSASGATEITFDQPVTRFGGWFGTNSNSPDGNFEFYDVANNLIISLQGTVPADCSWYWLGWQASGAQQIKRVLISSNTSGGAFLDMDDLQADFVAPGPTSYCTAKINSLGCTPALSFAGMPDASGATAFTLSATNVLGVVPGHLFYGLNGPATTPFKGGTMCVAQPIRRAPLQSSGGILGSCSGTLQLDFNAYCASGANPALTPGAAVWAQYWSLDPGFPAPNRASLTDAIRFNL